jgi:hypothetical protein
MAETETNVMPLRPMGPARKDPTAAARAKRFRERQKEQKKAVAQTSAPLPTVTQPTVAVPVRTVTVPIRAASENSNDFIVSDTMRNGSVTVRRRVVSWPLVIIAYGFFALGVGINIWNASASGPLIDVALPAAMGVLAEAVMFFLPAWAMTLSPVRQVLALALLVFVSVFALTNSLRMASIIAADQTAARADRQTEGVQTADRALETARARRDEACGRGLGKTFACQARQTEVTKLETNRIQATAKAAAQARPESGDFAKLVAWISRGTIQPGADDFAMLWLLFRTFLPQVGGLVLMLAQRSA